MTTNVLAPANNGRPVWSRLGQWCADRATSAIAYVGGFGLLLAAALVAPLRRRGDHSLVSEASRELEALLALGFPIVGLVHLSFGSVFAMQAFFRATFAETNGAVVGVTMLRSVAPLLAGIALACLLGVRCAIAMPRLSAGRAEPDVGRAALARLAAAVLAGPVLALWGAAVGTVMGALVSNSVLGVAAGTYFGFFFEMLQASDVIGVLVLSAAYAATAAAIACHESARSTEAPDGGAWRAAYRTVVLSAICMLFINGAWFSLVHISGAAAPFSVAGAPPAGSSLVAKGL
jgi:ABC-type transporter Mla maintaining outer membrane lipid asymmetry permease subunit MlaE